MCRRSIGGGVRSSPPSAWPSTAGSYARSAASTDTRAQRRRQRCAAVQERLALGVRLGGPAARAAEARVLQHPLQQLLGGLGRPELVELFRHVLAGQHQPRLELEQRRDQDEELGRRLEVQLALGLEVVDVREHDLRQLDLGRSSSSRSTSESSRSNGPAKTSRSSSSRWAIVAIRPAG